VAGGERVELWNFGKAELVGVGGVDAADESVNQAFMHLCPESSANVLTD
jgi:hypothetical protein